MYIYESWQGIKDKHRNIVVGLGNFDGVHIGHQRLIAGLVDMTAEIEGTPAVFTFHPHPQAVLHPENSPPLLLTQEAKQDLMARLGVKVLLLIPFNLDFARLSPEDFIETVLHKELDARGVAVGYNYTFGFRGRGTPEMLEKYAGVYGYRLKIVPPVTLDGLPVSSTRIRGLLLEGRVEEAARFLGYYPFIESEVVEGARRGSTLGFPTANLNIAENLLVPANGVYSTKVYVNDEVYLGVANIGVRPTFQGQGRNVEVHLLDFFQDLYGKKIKVQFTSRLRGEKRFCSPADLTRQIERDISQARILSVQAGE